MRISDWSSDVCSSDLRDILFYGGPRAEACVEAGALDAPRIACVESTVGGWFPTERELSREILVLGNGRQIQRLHARQNTLDGRSEEHTSELQSLMRISYAVFCLKKNTKTQRLYKP